MECKFGDNFRKWNDQCSVGSGTTTKSCVLGPKAGSKVLGHAKKAKTQDRSP